jgi:hypothetical protein
MGEILAQTRISKYMPLLAGKPLDSNNTLFKLPPMKLKFSPQLHQGILRQWELLDSKIDFPRNIYIILRLKLTNDFLIEGRTNFCSNFTSNICNLYTNPGYI